MMKQVPMTARQRELLNTASIAVKQSREQRDLDVLLEGMAAGLEGKMIHANVDEGQFTIEVPDIQEEKAS